jgi:hypothetical protein
MVNHENKRVLKVQQKKFENKLVKIIITVAPPMECRAYYKIPA